MRLNLSFSKIVTAVLLIIGLVQMPLSGEVLCLHQDGQIVLEFLSSGKCDLSDPIPTSSEISQRISNLNTSPGCTDLFLFKDVRLEPKGRDLLAALYAPDLSIQLAEATPPLFIYPHSSRQYKLEHKQITFFYHPSQTLQSIIFLI